MALVGEAGQSFVGIVKAATMHSCRLPGKESHVDDTDFSHATTCKSTVIVAELISSKNESPAAGLRVVLCTNQCLEIKD